MHQGSEILFCHETVHVSGIFCAHHQQLSVVHVTIGMFHAGYVEQPDSPRQRPHNLHETYRLSRVQLITADDGHRKCPKHVEFRDKIKFRMLDASCWLFIRKFLESLYFGSGSGHWKSCAYFWHSSGADVKLQYSEISSGRYFATC